MSEAVPAEFEAFLAEPRNAIMAVSHGPDRAPHATPVWFLYEDGVFRISITRTRAKFRLTERAPNVSLCIDDPTAFRTVVAEGLATFVDDDETLIAVAKGLRRKYRGGPPAPSDAELLRGLRAEQRVVVVVAPERVLSWGE